MTCVEASQFREEWQNRHPSWSTVTDVKSLIPAEDGWYVVYPSPVDEGLYDRVPVVAWGGTSWGVIPLVQMANELGYPANGWLQRRDRGQICRCDPWPKTTWCRVCGRDNPFSALPAERVEETRAMVKERML